MVWVKLGLAIQLMLLSVWLSGCRAAQLTYTLYKNKGFRDASSFGVVKSGLTESACVFQCNYASQSGGCFAAQYDSATLQCILIQTTCKLLQVDDNPTSTVYTLSSMVNNNEDADLLIPVSAATGLSVKKVFGKFSNLVSLSLTGSPTSTSFSTFGFMNKIPRLYNSPTAFPPTSFLTLQSNSLPSALHIFDASFTVSFYFRSTVYSNGDEIVNQPLLEFLGDETGQICYAWRLGCTRGCVRYSVVKNCSVSEGHLSNSANTPESGHYTAVYNSDRKTIQIFFNGAFSEGDPVSFPPPRVNVTRLIIGGSEVHDWYSNASDGFYGNIGCIQLFSKALTSDQVADLYKFCTGTDTQILV